MAFPVLFVPGVRVRVFDCAVPVPYQASVGAHATCCYVPTRCPCTHLAYGAIASVPGTERQYGATTRTLW
eukprot:3687011-Rhodomonas_salina.2